MKQKVNSADVQLNEAKTAMKTLRLKPKTWGMLSEVIEKMYQRFGNKRIKPDEVLCFALELLSDSHMAQIHERSQSNSERLERAYREYVNTKGAIGKDAFLGLVLEGKVNILKLNNKQHAA